MRVFDWTSLLNRQRVTYITRGANVKRGEINIRCPWCGSADPSQHMGINLETGWYSCWRNKAGHSGKSPLRLLMKLLGVSYGQARELAGLGDDYIDPEGFDATAARLMGRDIAGNSQVKVRREFLTLHKYFLEITNRPMTLRWWNYLYGRGFESDDIWHVCQQYSLRAARDGEYAGRLIIPYFLNGKLVTWTARAVAPSVIRYKDLSIEDSIVPVKQTLYNADVSEAKDRRVLVLVEGPLDTLKVDFYGQHLGVRAVGLSTNSMTEEQEFMLETTSALFDRTLVMMDNKTGLGLVDSMRLKQRLSFIPGLAVVPVPFNRPDPGDLTAQEVIRWSESIVSTRRT